MKLDQTPSGTSNNQDPASAAAGLPYFQNFTNDHGQPVFYGPPTQSSLNQIGATIDHGANQNEGRRRNRETTNNDEAGRATVGVDKVGNDATTEDGFDTDQEEGQTMDEAQR